MSKTNKEVNILYTSDVHSHLNSFKTKIEGEDKVVGGFARLNTLMEEHYEENPNTLYVDGGDFSMGTLIQTVYAEEATELRMLGKLGCEVTTLGNHEFDYRMDGLAGMINNALKSGDEIPQMVICNIDWNAMEEAGLNEGQQAVKDAFEAYDVKDYIVLEKGDVKIAVTGVLGKEAYDQAPMCDLIVKDPIEAVKSTVETIKANESADMIVCVSHSGLNEENIEESEDVILATNVPELDVIVSGHSHTLLEEPLVYGDTHIVAPGEYGEYLGNIALTQKEDGRWEMKESSVTLIDTSVKEDKEIQKEVDTFMESVDKEYLSQFGYTRNQVLAENNVKFSQVEDLSANHDEQNLGMFIADAYNYAVENADDFDGHKVDIAVAPAGTIRDTYPIGDITVENVFHSFSLGIGQTDVVGYPLISAYLTGKEVKRLAEVDASISDLMTATRLYMNGLNFTYNPNRIILNKVSDLYLTGENGERIEVEDDQLYRVVTDLYSGQMIGAVKDLSYGLLPIEPKFADGTVIEDLNDAIIMENGAELKGWQAIAQYMESFEDTDGDEIGNVPEYYATTHDRKVVDDSTSLSARFSNLNEYSMGIMGVVILLVGVLVLGIKGIRKLMKKFVKKDVDK